MAATNFPNLNGQPELLENQISTGALIAIGVAAALGLVLLTRRGAAAAPAVAPSPVPAPAPAPAAPKCIGTRDALDRWANAYNLTLVFLPQRRQPPPSVSELSAMGVDVSSTLDLVVVLQDTSFWTYDTGAPVSARNLRSDYCATVT